MDMSNIIKQARDFQQKMSRVQEELAQKTVTSTVGGGMLTVSMNGRYELLSVEIEKEVIDPEDPGLLQDLIVSGVNDVMRKAQEMAQAEMSRLTGGVNIPGLFR